MTQEEIVYQHYLKSTTKSRDEAIELLKKRDFTTLHRNYIHWFNKKEKNVKLKSTTIKPGGWQYSFFMPAFSIYEFFP